MTKEEVLQKANEYCSEKGYTNETLTDEFKEKFSDFFSKKYQETDANDESMLEDLHFNLNTAFSATSKGVTSKQKAFEEKENEYLSQIEELNKKLGKRNRTKEACDSKGNTRAVGRIEKVQERRGKERAFRKYLEYCQERHTPKPAQEF